MGVVLQYLSEIVSFVVGALGGAAVTFSLTRNSIKGEGVITDQSKSKAGGDVVGRDKVTKKN